MPKAGEDARAPLGSGFAALRRNEKLVSIDLGQVAAGPMPLNYWA